MENESDEQTVPVRTLRGTRLRGGEKTNLPTANTVRATEVPSFWCVRSYRSGSNIPSQIMGAFQGVHVCTSSLDLGQQKVAPQTKNMHLGFSKPVPVSLQLLQSLGRWCQSQQVDPPAVCGKQHNRLVQRWAFSPSRRPHSKETNE